MDANITTAVMANTEALIALATAIITLCTVTKQKSNNSKNDILRNYFLEVTCNKDLLNSFDLEQKDATNNLYTIMNTYYFS